MPPKPKFSKQAIVETAFELVRSRGTDALTARELGKCLGTSSSPIFTVFNDMEELRCAVMERAWELFNEYMTVAEGYDPAYKMRGIQWISFARREPRLFETMFMQRSKSEEDFDRTMQVMPFGKENDIAIIMRDYHATKEQAEHLFRQMWIYTYGLCALCATGVCTFTDDEISAQLSEIFGGMIYVIKSQAATIPMPAKHESVEGAENRAQFPDLAAE